MNTEQQMADESVEQIVKLEEAIERQRAIIEACIRKAIFTGIPWEQIYAEWPDKP